MILPFFVLVLTAASVSSIVLILWRPQKLLARIQLILFAIFLVAAVIGFKMAMWIHSMGFNDPVRQHFENFAADNPAVLNCNRAQFLRVLHHGHIFTNHIIRNWNQIRLGKNRQDGKDKQQGGFHM